MKILLQEFKIQGCCAKHCQLCLNLPGFSTVSVRILYKTGNIGRCTDCLLFCLIGSEIEVGSIKITWTEVLIGFQSSLIVLPINFLVVFLFRRAMPSSVFERIQKERKKVLKDVESSASKNNKSENLAFQRDSLGLDFFYRQRMSYMEDPDAVSNNSIQLNSIQLGELNQTQNSVEDDYIDSSMFAIKYKYSSVSGGSTLG